MAQGRMLSQTIAEDEELNRCSEDAALLYLHTLPHLDRDGLITGRPLLLARTALPLRVRFIDIAGQLLEEWLQHGLVIRYPGAKGEPVLFFKGFRKNNAHLPYEHEKPSKFPPPPGWQRTPYGLVPLDPTVRLAMAESFHPNSLYRQALLEPEGWDAAITAQRQRRKPKADHPKNTSRDKVPTKSRLSRDLVGYQDQDQDQYGGDGDQSITHSQRGIDHHHQLNITGAEHLFEFSESALRRAAVELGPMLFGSDFRGYGRYVAEADMSTLAGLLEWMAYFWERMDRISGIRELPAYVRSCLNHGDRPGLTTKERQWLVEQVAAIQMEGV
jgi:hypothetical protein